MPTVVACKYCGKSLTPTVRKIYIKGIGALCKEPCSQELLESKEQQEETKEKVKSTLGCERTR